MTPGQRGRLLGRALLAIAFGAVGLVLFVVIATQGAPRPMFRTPPDILGLPVDLVLAVVGSVGAVVGLTWMIRIYRADPEPDQHAWRYRSRDTTMGLGRLIATTIICAAIAATALVGILWFTAPGQIGRILRDLGAGSVEWRSLILVLGVMGVVVGSMWVVRIARGGQEPDQHAWRYRSRGR